MGDEDEELGGDAHVEGRVQEQDAAPQVVQFLPPVLWQLLGAKYRICYKEAGDKAMVMTITDLQQRKGTHSLLLHGSIRRRKASDPS